MDPLARVLELLALLQGTPVWSAADLATRLDTTTRTIRRDVSRLRSMGYRISSEPGRYGGYRLDRGRAVPPLLLTPDEAVALAIGLRLAGPAGIDRLDGAADAALTKLENVLPPAAWSRVVALDAATVRDPVPATDPVDPDVLTVCAMAIRDRQRIRIDYRPAYGQIGTRRVDASALVQTERRWYLVAFDLTRRDWRSFRVDRIAQARPVGPADPLDPPSDPVDLVREGTAVRAYRWQAEVVVHGPVKWVRAAVPPSVARVESLGDQRTLLRTGGHNLDMIAALVAGLGLHVEVRQPPELVEALHRLGRRLLTVS